MLSNLWTFIKSKTFIINLAIIFLLISLASYAVINYLNNYTHHGESITVPDLKGMPPEQLELFLPSKELRYKIIDSIYRGDQSPGVVLEQDPAPESKVKQNRTIYLTVNAHKPPKVKMPNLVDVSLRQAEAILQTYGLKTGRLTYKPDLAKNAVLEQYFHGKPIAAGIEIYKNSMIDLDLGDGLGNVEIPVPNLVGLTKGEALFVLKGSSLLVGTITFDDQVKNEDNAKVYKQFPEYSIDNALLIKQGEAIDIFLR